MKMRILAVLAAMSVASVSFAATEGSDSASTYGGTWANGSGANAAFSAWSISAVQGTGFAGSFIGNPSADAGISGMASTAFGLYANPGSSGASVTADRSFVGALSVGQTFSITWGINWDSGASGNKGFNLYTGGVGGTQIINVNNAANSDITVNAVNTTFGYGVSAMTWSFTLLDSTTLQVQANDRDGVGTYSANITVAGAPDAIRLYASDMQSGNNAQPYFDNLQVVPEPTTMALALFGVLSAVVARRRLQK